MKSKSRCWEIAPKAIVVKKNTEKQVTVPARCCSPLAEWQLAKLELRPNFVSHMIRLNRDQG